MNFANNAFSVLNGAITNVATAITLATGTGSRFPVSDFRVTLIGYDGSGNENAWEICHCASRSGDVLTLTRGQEGTTAVAWANAARVENRLTAGSLGELLYLTGGTMTGPLVGTAATFSTSVTTGLHVMSGASPTIRTATADGADNAVLALGGGGAIDTTRGALLALYGNEHATNAGDVALYAGTGGDVMLKGLGGYFYGNQAAGSVGFTLGNEAANAVNNATRLRFSPAAGFIGAPAVAPYIEAVVENGTTLASRVAIGTYNGSTLVEGLRVLSSGVTRIASAATFSSQFNAGNSGTAATVNFANGQKQLLTLTGNATVTLSFPGVGNYQLLLTQDATGSRTVTWSGVSRYVGSATAPAINTAASTSTVVSLYYDGTNVWLGASKVNA